ncbi:MAG: DivIVA domain-containing protein [Clostridiaceae bacterium]|nr:DivIVA domain-containing protein [Clostridiaceae bacterium]
MLTPQDIQDVKFVKSIKGYDKDQVEDFLDIVHGDYTALYKENATLKGKMRVLVDKIEEYRLVDEQMRKAFYSAQMTAQDIVAKAQSEADSILRGARHEAENKVNDIKEQIVAEEKRLEIAKAECRKYVAMMNRLLEENVRLMAENSRSLDVIMEKSAEKIISEASDAKKERIESFEVDLGAQTSPDLQPEVHPEADAVMGEDTMSDTVDLEKVMKDEKVPVAAGKDKDIEDSTRFNFSELRFGKDYKEDEN